MEATCFEVYFTIGSLIFFVCNFKVCHRGKKNCRHHEATVELTAGKPVNDDNMNIIVKEFCFT